jgi:hypothetical protein
MKRYPIKVPQRYAALDFPESQRDSDSKPRVATQELPWVGHHLGVNPNGVVARITPIAVLFTSSARYS